MKWVVDPWNSTQTSGSRKYARTKAVYIACKPKCCTLHKDLVCDHRVCMSLTECYSFIADHVIESHDVFMRSVAVGEKYSTDILANHIGSPSSAFHFWLAENFLKVHSPAALQMSSCLVVCALSVWPDYILMCVGWLPMQTPSVQTLVISADVDRQGLQSRLVSGWREGKVWREVCNLCTPHWAHEWKNLKTHKEWGCWFACKHCLSLDLLRSYPPCGECA